MTTVSTYAGFIHLTREDLAKLLAPPIRTEQAHSLLGIYRLLTEDLCHSDQARANALRRAAQILKKAYSPNMPSSEERDAYNAWALGKGRWPLVRKLEDEAKAIEESIPEDDKITADWPTDLLLEWLPEDMRNAPEGRIVTSHTDPQTGEQVQITLQGNRPRLDYSHEGSRFDPHVSVWAVGHKVLSQRSAEELMATVAQNDQITIILPVPDEHQDKVNDILCRYMAEAGRRGNTVTAAEIGDLADRILSLSDCRPDLLYNVGRELEADAGAASRAAVADMLRASQRDTA